MPPEQQLPRRGETIAEAAYRGHVFDGVADFSDCVFTTMADFSGAVFKDRVTFNGATFEGGADFSEAVFEAFAALDDVTVTGPARFTGARFAAGLSVRDFAVEGDLRLDRATFDRTVLMGPLRADAVDLRLAMFPRRVRLELDARQVRCERSSFQGGVQFLLGPADIVLKDCELGPASLLAMHTGLPYAHEGARPRLLSVSGTDVSTLTISRVDLSVCKWVYAHGLDRVRVTVDDAFGWSPPGHWVARRQVIADEVRWRAAHGRRRERARWRPPPEWPELSPPPTAGHVVKTYRALRKATEEAKDEPGAADFYYGEMEMRRFGRRLQAREAVRARHWRSWLVARVEHALLWVYWLVSGYGLRASRALTALAVVVLLAAVAFLQWGFTSGTPHMDFAGAVRFSLRAATSILRGPEQKLTAAGEWIELVLRLTGPVLFGLSVLAVRGRVKR